MSTFASRRANQKRNKYRRILKNRKKYRPKDGHMYVAGASITLKI